MDKREYIEWTEAWFDGQLNGAEKAEYEKALAEDPALREEHRRQASLLALIESQNRQDLRKIVNQFAEQHRGEPKAESGKVRVLWPRITAVAVAAVAIILLLPFWPVNPVEVSNRYRQPFSIEQMRGGNDEPEEAAWQSFRDHYRSGDMVAAIEANRRLPDSLQTPDTQFLLGVCLFQADSLDKAERVFNLLPDDSNRREEIRWYLAMIDIRQGRVAEARQTLKEICAAEYHYRREDACSLQKDLGRQSLWQKLFGR